MLLKIKSTLTASQSSLAKEKGKKKKIDSLEIDTRIETRALFFLEIKSIGILDVSRATKPTYRRFNFHLAHRHTHTHTHRLRYWIKKNKKKRKKGGDENSEGNRFLSSGGGRSPISPTRFVARWIVKQRRYLLLPSFFPFFEYLLEIGDSKIQIRSRDFRDGSGNTFVIKGNIDLEISFSRPKSPFRLDNNFYREEYREWILRSNP